MAFRKEIVAFAVAAALAAGCGSDDSPPPSSSNQLKVMTRNLYLGAAIERAFPPAVTDVPSLLAATTAIWQMVQKNDFTDRARALAAEIAAQGPDLVGLQEVSLWRTQTPGDAAIGGTTPATTVAYDYLALLLQELQVRGLTYTAVATVELTDVELPVPLGGTPPAFMDVRFTDRGVILARQGVTATGGTGQAYSPGNSLTVPLPGGTNVPVKRGWLRTNVVVNGRPVTFVSTHLESASPQVRTAQANELMTALAGDTGRVVAVGDFNSDPGTEGHLAATTAGFTDAWTAVHGQDPGLTCCWPEDLTLTTPPFHSRIDLVLTRGALRPTAVTIVGEEQADRTPAPGNRWPSDHAGVSATIDVQ
jgi:endonuclease/exonuclease/phosphatase family metal-dependent hydrolase